MADFLKTVRCDFAHRLSLAKGRSTGLGWSLRPMKRSAFLNFAKECRKTAIGFCFFTLNINFLQSFVCGCLASVLRPRGVDGRVRLDIRAYIEPRHSRLPMNIVTFQRVRRTLSKDIFTFCLLG